MRRLRHDHRSFYDLARMAAPRVVVTPVLVTVCVLVWILMVVRAGTAADPNAPSLFNWGGNSGVSVFLGREYWRLLTGTFLHAGILHLAFNMWCLGRLGPLIERLYGYVGFALLYIASGIGGSLASAWWHPLVVGVGASGAIFGILGGLLAFLLVHRHGIPPSVFHSLRSAVVFFVGFNVLNGLAADQIDNAAHLGGLAGGLVAGILLSRPWPSRGPFDGLVRQLLRMIPIALMLGVVSLLVADRVRKSPEVLQLVQSYDAPRVAYNSLMKSLEPRLIQFDSLNRELNEFLQHASESSSPDPARLAILDRMLAELARSQNLVSAVSTTDPDLRQATDSFQAAQGRLGQALRSLRAALAEEDVTHLDGPEGYKASMTQLKADIESFHAKCRKYLQDHELVAVPGAP
ncbi:MAG: rhomboid family intramembrane serine protease [Isosphaeraceae bacterium]